MRIGVDTFKGTAPGISDRGLPEFSATVCSNARLRSGDLEPYKNPVLLNTLKGSVGNPTVSNIYPMDRSGALGGPFWLSWLQAETVFNRGIVNVAKAPVANDDKEVTVYTGVKNVGVMTPDDTNCWPKVTTIDDAIFGPGSDPYPRVSYILGVPAPVNPITVTQTIDQTETQFTYIASDRELVLSNANSLDGFNVISNVAVVPFFGVGGSNAFEITCTGGFGPSSTLYKNIKFPVGGSATIKSQFDIPNQTNQSDIRFKVVFGANDLGNGNYIELKRNLAGTLLEFTRGSITDWDNAGTPAGSMATFPYTGGYLDLTLKSDYDTVANTYTLYVTVSSGIVVLYSTSFQYTPVGGVIGYLAQNNTGTTTFPFVRVDNISLIGLIPENSVNATNYVYTYVNSFGQEGAPSAPSDLVYIGPGINTTLTIPGPLPSAYPVDDVFVYRAATGSSGTQYLFNFEAPAPNVPTNYPDTLEDSELGEALTTELYDLPPIDGRNVVSMANGIMVMSSKNTLCPSVSYQYHAYPVSYRLSVDFPVIAIGSLDTFAVVCTQEATYIMTGSDPSAMSLSKLSSSHGCVSPKSLARWGDFGIIFATAEGLAIANPSGVKLITEGFISKREWQAKYFPSTIFGVVHEDKYYGNYVDGSGNRRGFIFDPRSNSDGFVDTDQIVKASFADHFSERNFYSDGIDLYAWDEANTLKTYSWKSKLFQLPYPMSFSIGQIYAVNFQGFTGSSTLNLYKDRSNVPFFTVPVTQSMQFRLPSIVCEEIQIELVGTARVNKVQIAEETMELV